MTASISSVKKCDGKPPASSSSAIVPFSAFLGTLPRVLEDERDICGCSSWDPAVDSWMVAADASLSATKAACAAVLAPLAAGEADRCMQRVARLFMDVIEATNSDEVADLRTHARLRRWAYLVPSEIVGASQINRRVNVALDALGRWLALDDQFDARAESWAGPDLDGDVGLVPSA